MALKTFKSKGTTKRKGQFCGKSVKRRKIRHYSFYPERWGPNFQYDIPTLERECIDKKVTSTKDETITVYKFPENESESGDKRTMFDIYKTSKYYHFYDLTLDESIPLTPELDSNVEEVSNFKIRYTLYSDTFTKLKLEQVKRSYFKPGLADQNIIVDFGRELDILSMYTRQPVPNTFTLYETPIDAGFHNHTEYDKSYTVYTVNSKNYTTYKSAGLTTRPTINVRIKGWRFTENENTKTIQKYEIQYRKEHGQWNSLGLFKGPFKPMEIVKHPIEMRCRYIKIIPTETPKKDEDLRIMFTKKRSECCKYKGKFKTIKIKTKHDSYNPKYEIKT